MDTDCYREAEILSLFSLGLTDPKALRSGLKSLEAEFDAANGQFTLLLNGAPPLITFTGFDQATMEQYAQYVEHDVWLNRYLELDTQRVMRGSDLVSRQELDRSLFKADMLKPLGLGYSLGAGKHNESGVVLLSFQRGGHDFSEQQVDRLEYYYRLLRGFIVASQRMNLLKQSNFSLASLAERCPEPALVVDRESRVICCNRAFEQMRLPSVDQVDYCLRVRQRPLHHWVERWPQGDGMEVIRVVDRCPLILERLYPAPLYFVTCFREQTLSSTTRVKLVQVRYKLTGAEAELVELLTEGLTLEAIADRRCVSYYTVRSHLRSVFTKTGCHNQSELVLMAR